MQREEAVTRLRSVPIELCAPGQFGRELKIAREQNVSTYDAGYLELALRTDSELATLDRALASAASRLGVLAEECVT